VEGGMCCMTEEAIDQYQAVFQILSENIPEGFSQTEVKEITFYPQDILKGYPEPVWVVESTDQTVVLLSNNGICRFGNVRYYGDDTLACMHSIISRLNYGGRSAITIKAIILQFGLDPDEANISVIWFDQNWEREQVKSQIK
jgi:hypothetical protein